MSALRERMKAHLSKDACATPSAANQYAFRNGRLETALRMAHRSVDAPALKGSAPLVSADGHHQIIPLERVDQRKWARHRHAPKNNQPL